MDVYFVSLYRLGYLNIIMKGKIGVKNYLIFHFQKMLKKTSTKYSPYYLLFGRDAKIPHDMLKSDEEIDISLCDKNIDNNIREAEVKRNDINKKVLENIKNAQGKQKKYYEQVRSSRYKCFNLKVGDKVLRKNFESLKKVGGKLKPKWLGKYLIHSIDKHNRIILKDLKKNKILKFFFHMLI